MPVRWAVFNPINTDQALLATEMGVWSTDDLNGSSTNWGATNFNLANTRVDMLQVRASDNLIVAATHGRGLFTTDDFSQARVNFSQNSSSVSEYSAANECPNYTDVQVGIQSVPSLLSADVEVGITIDSATTATQGVDFELLNSSFTYLASGNPTQFFTLRIYDDAVIESAETVVLNLEILNPVPSGANNGTQLQHVLTIQDDDVDPSAAANNIAEIGSYDYALFSATPFRGNYEDERYQTIMTADELLNAGFTAGIITELAFFVDTKYSTQPYSGFTIKLANTSETDLSGDFSSVATTQVYSADYETVEGWNNFTFSTPFSWDGTSNLLIETCFNNASYTDDDAIGGYDVGNYLATYSRTDGADGCAIEFSTYISTYKPYIRLNIGTSIDAETALVTSQEEELGPNQTVYFYAPDGNIMAKIENLSAHDYGCTTVTIDRAGTGAIAQLGVETTEKAYFITPSNNNPTSSFSVTLYYTEAEIAGFEAINTGGQSRNDLKIAKSEMSFDTATTAIVQATSFMALPSGVLAFTATFSDGLSGFTLANGIPDDGGGGMTCPTFILFENEIIPSGIYQASDYIATQGTVDLVAGASVTLEASNVVTLSPGFTAANGTTLTIKNTFSPGGDCTPALLQQAIAGRSEAIEALEKLSLTFSPNPFRDVANITYFLPESGNLNLQLYDLNGKLVKTLVTTQQQAEGYHQISFSATDWKSGLYLLVLNTQKQKITQKIVVMK
ncbi:MAG: T9SS type A sorting domain-containing protein [Saprospiraceae bacterium]|nr:T9SS type A sorting domain-containing protein [Saprospiraceae bacterium]